MQIMFEGLTLADVVTGVANFLEETGFEIIPLRSGVAAAATTKPDKTPPLPPPPAGDGDANPDADRTLELLDSSGYPWHSSIHTKNKSTNGDGTWRNKRGSVPEEVKNVRAADRERGLGVAADGAPPKPSAPGAPAAPAAPVAPAGAPANSPEVAACVQAASALMEGAMGIANPEAASGNESAKMGEFIVNAMREHGMEKPEDVPTNPDKAPALLVSLQAIGTAWGLPC